MVRNPANMAFAATSGCVFFATVAALLLIVYSVLMFLSLAPAAVPPQDLVGLAF